MDSRTRLDRRLIPNSSRKYDDADPWEQLLHAVFEECNISFSKALCMKIAERVGNAGVGTSSYSALSFHSPTFHKPIPSVPCAASTDDCPECTPKAVENRLYSWKKKNVGSNPSATSTTNNSTTPASTPSKPTAKKPATPKVPRTPKSAGRKKVTTPQPEDDDDEEMFQESPSKKRGLSSAGDKEEEGMKKVKLEVQEEVGGFEV